MSAPCKEKRKPQEMQILLESLSIREKVFIEEQGVPRNIEQDGRDNESGHVVLWVGDVPAGTSRFRETEEGIKLERLALLPQFRKKHLGRLLLIESIRAIRMASLTKRIYLHAQQQALPFYTASYFEATEEHTVEGGIPHVTMFLPIENEEELLEQDQG